MGLGRYANNMGEAMAVRGCSDMGLPIIQILPSAGPWGHVCPDFGAKLWQNTAKHLSPETLRTESCLAPVPKKTVPQRG